MTDEPQYPWQPNLPSTGYNHPPSTTRHVPVDERALRDFSRELGRPARQTTQAPGQTPPKGPIDARRGQSRPRAAQPAFAQPLLHTAFWDDNPTSWDQVALAGYLLPGICEIRTEVSRKFDAVSPSGSDGATIRDKGYEPAKIKITMRIWTREHLAQWDQILPRLNPRRNAIKMDRSKRAAVSITSAPLAQLEITQVFITSISPLEAGSHKGIRECTIQCVEYSPPTRVNVTHTVKPGSRLENTPTALTPAVQTPAETEGHP